MNDSTSKIDPSSIVDCWNDDERMNFLFSAFPLDRSTNPHHWDTKMIFWKNLIKEISIKNPYGYTTWDYACQCLKRNGKLPLGLQTIFTSFLQSGEMVLESQYVQDIKSNETWMGWGVKWCVRKPVTWMADKVLSPIKTSPHKNIRSGKFVLVSALEAKCDKLMSNALQYISENRSLDHDFLNIISYSKLQELVSGILCDRKSLDLALLTLKKNKLIDIWSANETEPNVEVEATETINERYIKFSKSGQKTVSPISETDIGIIKLCETKVHLNDAIEKSYHEMEQCTEKARMCLKNNQRTLAKSALRRKARIKATLEKKEGSLNNVEQLLESLQQCKTDKMVMDTYKTAVAAYKQATNGLSLDEVENTMDDVANVLDTQSDIADALSGARANAQDDVQELEDELSALLNAEENHDPLDDLCNKFGDVAINGNSQRLPEVPNHSPKAAKEGLSDVRKTEQIAV